MKSTTQEPTEEQLNLLLKIQVDLATPKGFSEWLQQHSLDDRVGFRNSNCDCPISSYIVMTHKVDNVSSARAMMFYFQTLGEGEIIFNRKSDKYPEVPRWIQDFIEITDTTNLGLTTVSAQEAIAILEKIENPSTGSKS